MFGFTRIKSLSSHQAEVWCIIWTKSGDFLVSGSSDSFLYIWGNTYFLSYMDYGTISSCEISKFMNWGKLAKLDLGFLSTTFRSLCRYDSLDGILIGSFLGKCFFGSISFVKFPISLRLKIVDIIDIAKSEIKSVEFSPNGAFLAITTRNKELWVWKIKEGCEFQIYQTFFTHESDLKNISWHPSGNFLSTSSYGGILTIFKIEPKNILIIHKIKFSKSTIWLSKFIFYTLSAIIWFQDGSMIKIALYPSDNAEKVINFDKKFRVLLLPNCRNGSNCSDISRINAKVLSGFSLANIAFYNLWSKYCFSNNLLLFKRKDINFSIYKKERENHRSHLASVDCISWNPVNGKVFASSGEDKFINIWMALEI
mmetsp:Transcript_44432/g.69470  ORF Transcript_44432/g.69470 Transcript_44432/m.69470 type:complete len:368 (-) Transcript_44432:2223-3326(-)